MDQNTMDKLHDMIEKRKERAKISGGEIFAVWGILIISSILIQVYWIHSLWVSIITLLTGIVFQIAYVRLRRMKGGFITLWNSVMNLMWLFIVTVLFITGGVFPLFFKLYKVETGAVLNLFFLAPGMYFSGLLSEKLSFKIGGIIFILSSIIMALPFIENKQIVAVSAILFGLILPGLFSKLEEKFNTTNNQ